MQFKDYYQVLGVAPDADEKAIKSAYRRLARKYHPDVSKEAGAEEKFKAANEANEVLGNRERRAEYDRLRASGYRPGDSYQPPNWGGPSQGGPGFEGFGESGFSDFFESLFGRSRAGRASAPGPIPDARAHLDVDLESIYAGASQRVDVNGKTLEIKIPAGIAAGQVIRLKGQGGQGRDLLLEIGYRAHPTFSVEGRDVIVHRTVTPWEAALGTQMEVPTLGGTVHLSVPAGSGSGQRLRLRGRGMPGTPNGDQFVVLDLRAPKPSTEAQRAAYEALAKAFADSGRHS
ncbi:MAG TPA: DnaJ C-terminal domain-containing protein [Chiayiivirga sp.]|nr:DnaJ C-terminal domain-containing protein [Chiayiivirga sp.]